MFEGKPQERIRNRLRISTSLFMILFHETELFYLMPCVRLPEIIVFSRASLNSQIMILKEYFLSWAPR